MHILLFIIYSLLCVYGILKVPFIRKSGIRPAFLILFFGLHVLTGLLHNIIAYRYYPEHGDIWNFYQWGFLARHRLLHDRALFLADNNTMTYITHNGIIWIYMVLNTVSLGSLTIDTLLFSFPVFLGNIALFRLFRRRFPNATLAACTIFLLPSALFWTSCIHREAVLYMLLGFLFYSFDRLLTPPGTAADSMPSSADSVPSSAAPPRRRKYRIALLGCLLLILYFRFSLLASLLPALAAWLLAEKRRPSRHLMIFSGAALLLLLILTFLFPAFFASLAQAIASRQQEFAGLEGHSRLPLPVMDGTWTSIAKVLPYAILNGLFEPLPGSGGQTIYLAFSFELLAIWLIVVTALVRPIICSRQAASPPSALPPGASRPFILCCLVFALSGQILIGAIIPFAGAIVRYRSIFLPFLLAPALYSLHSTPLIRRLDSWLSRRLLDLPKTGENTPSY